MAKSLDEIENLRDRAKKYSSELGSVLLDGVFLIVWVALQGGVHWVIDQFAPVPPEIKKWNIENWTVFLFEVMFALTTLSVVGIYLREDIVKIKIRSDRRISREHQESLQRTRGQE